MGKTAPLKKKGPPPIRSRAARRATSPSLNTDKSLKAAKPPSPGPDTGDALSRPMGGGGIAKRKRKSQQMSSKRRKRLERSMEMAEVVMDRTEKKVELSVGRGKKVRERRGDWEDVNDKITGKKGRRKAQKQKGEQQEMDVDDESGEVDDADGQDMGVDKAAAAIQAVAIEEQQGEDEVL